MLIYNDPKMNQRRVLLLQLALILAVCAFMFYYGLGAFGLVGADEPRYAQIAREMFGHHHWVVPTLNGQPWLEKPVLLYWKIINSYAIFGVHDWAARIPSASHATTLVLVVFFFMRRFRPGTELDAALITISCFGMVGFARGASTDMVLSAPFCMAMLAWWAWHETTRKLWLTAFYVLLALGVLAKGPVAPVLAVLIVGAYAVLRRDKKIFLGTLWWMGFLLFFAIALPWYVAVQIKAPQFFHTFFIEHNLERFGTNLYQHKQPFWFYIPVFLLGMLPWTVFTLTALVEAVRKGIQTIKRSDGDNQERDWLQLFLLLWTVVPIVFFSISRSKLPGYILPAVPAAALLTADYLHRSVNALARWRVAAHAVLCGAILGAALLAPWFMLRQHPPRNLQAWALITTVAIALIVFLLVRQNGLRALHFATLVPVILAVGFLLRPSAHALDLATSARAVNAQLESFGIPAHSLAVFNVKREVEYGLNFYRNAPVSRYERAGVPARNHVVIAKEGSEGAVQAMVGNRQVREIGSFPPQHLEFFLVSNPR